MIERMNRSINEMLSNYTQSRQRDWDQYLDFLVLAYNSIPNERAGVGPHKMVYGREMNFPLEIKTEPLEVRTQLKIRNIHQNM